METTRWTSEEPTPQSLALDFPQIIHLLCSSCGKTIQTYENTQITCSCGTVVDGSRKGVTIQQLERENYFLFVEAERRRERSRVEHKTTKDLSDMTHKKEILRGELAAQKGETSQSNAHLERGTLATLQFFSKEIALTQTEVKKYFKACVAKRVGIQAGGNYLYDPVKEILYECCVFADTGRISTFEMYSPLWDCGWEHKKWNAFAPLERVPCMIPLELLGLSHKYLATLPVTLNSPSGHHVVGLDDFFEGDYSKSQVNFLLFRLFYLELMKELLIPIFAEQMKALYGMDIYDLKNKNDLHIPKCISP